MVIIGRIDTNESTVSLYQWSLLPATDTNCYKEITVEQYKNNQLVRKVSFSKAFVVNYTESYSNHVGVGTFTLYVRQFCGKDIEVTSQELNSVSNLTPNLPNSVEKDVEVVEIAEKQAVVKSDTSNLKQSNMSITDRLAKQKEKQDNTNIIDNRPKLPDYDGKTTHGILVTPNSEHMPFSSGNPNPNYKNYIPASHVEGKSAIYMRENGITSGTIYYNNTDGTCPYCDKMLSTLLEEGSVLEVIPPINAKAPKPSWVDKPKTYIGNNKVPKPNK